MTMPLALFDLSTRAALETNAITAQDLNRNDSRIFFEAPLRRR